MNPPAQPGPARRAVACVLALPLFANACTVFDDLGLPADSGFTPFDPAYLSVEQAARVCRWAAECDRLPASIAASIGVPVDARNFSLCMHWLAGPLPRERPGEVVQAEMLANIAAAASCGDAVGQAFVQVLDPEEPLCADVPAAACADDATAVQCAYARLVRCDSPRFEPSSRCTVVEQDGEASGVCANGVCADAQSSCVDGVGSLCVDGATVRPDCAALGMSCYGSSPGTCGPGGWPPTGCPRDQLGASECGRGDRARVCDGTIYIEFWCGKADATCVAEHGAARCVPYATECSPFDADMNRCAGDLLDVCVGGRRTAVDCTAMGLRCLPAADGAAGRCASE